MTFSEAQRREIHEIIGLYGVARNGIVTSWQSNPPMVKVQFMPPPPTGSITESGWIPVLTSAAGYLGNGWRVVIPSMVGAQAFLEPVECDGENFVVTGFYYSDEDPAPQGVNPGEILMENESGAQVYLQNGGTISLITPRLNIAAPQGGEAAVNITGSLNVSVETTTAGKAFVPHTHQYVPGGNPPAQTTPTGN